MIFQKVLFGTDILSVGTLCAHTYNLPKRAFASFIYSFVYQMPRFYSQAKNANTASNLVNDPFYLMSVQELRQNVGKFAYAFGMDRAGNFQVQYMPTPCVTAGNFKGMLGNASSQSSNEPAFVFVDKDDSAGYSTVITAFNETPSTVRPKKPLPNEVLEGTDYESPNKPLGLWTMGIMGYGLFQSDTPSGSILDKNDQARAEAINNYDVRRNSPTLYLWWPRTLILRCP